MQQLNAGEMEWLTLPSAPLSSGVSQRQQFEANPRAYLTSVLKQNKSTKLPHFIAGFTAVMENLSGILSKYGYREQENRLWNCFSPANDNNSECSVTVYVLRDERINK